MVIISDPSSSLSSRGDKLLVSLFLSIKSFSVSGRLSPHNFEMLSISPFQAYPIVVGVPTTPFDRSHKDAFKLIRGRRYCFLHRSFIPSSHFFRRHRDVALLNPSSCFVRDYVLLLAYPFNRSVVPLLKFF